jgi:acylphosphatase
MKTQLHVIISGRVQGVWFRVSTKEKADQLGITGWVKNNNDGNVEALFEGEKKNLQEMISWCHNGPSNAIVENVKIVEENQSNNVFDNFSIRY